MLSERLQYEIRPQHNDTLVVVIIDPIQTVSTQDVSSVLKQVSNAVRDVQWNELREAGAILSEEFGVDWNLESAKIGKADLKDVTRVVRVAEGSLVFEALVTGAAFFVLNATLGETVKQAYKESQTHERWKQRLTKVMDTQILPQRVERLLMALSRKKQAGNIQLSEVSIDKQKNTVTVKLTGPDAPSMPLYSEVD